MPNFHFLNPYFSEQVQKQYYLSNAFSNNFNLQSVFDRGL